MANSYFRLLFCLLASAFQPVFGQGIDQAFNVNALRFGAASSMATLPSGHVVLLGEQLYTNGQLTGGLVRFLPTGEFDEDFFRQTGLVSNGTVDAANPYRTLVRAYADGGLLLVGATANNVANNGVQRLLPSGQVDAAFYLPATVMLPSIRTAAIQPDGKILLAGLPNSYSQAPCLLRLNADGSLDPTFRAALGNARTDYVQTLAVQPDGRILVGGRFTQPATGLVRLLPDGTHDPSFQAALGGGGVAEEVLCRPNGRILVAGSSSLVVQGRAGGLHQLLADGRRDPDFESAPSATYSLVRFGDNRRLHLLPGGRLCLLPLAPAPAAVFLLPNGRPDPARPPLTSWPLSSLTAATPDSAGQLLLSGTYRHRGGPPSNLVRVLANGQRDPRYAPQLCTLGTIGRMVEQPGLGVVLAGTFDLVNGVLAPNIARLLPITNKVDTAFIRRLPRLATLDRIAVQPPASHLLITGFYTIDERPASGLLRLTPDGRLDTLFRRRPVGYTTPGLAVQADGRILVSGTLGDAVSGRGVARLLSNGDNDPSFVPPPNSASAYSNTRLLVQPDGRVLLLATTGLARLQANGSTDPTFQPTEVKSFASLLIDDAVLQADGRLTLCGQMPPTLGYARNCVVRLLPNGRRDSTLANIYPAPDFRTRVLAYQPDGRLLLGGIFYPNAGQELALRQYLPTGQPDPAAVALPGVGNVASLLRTSTGQVLVGGYFLQANSAATQHFSLLALGSATALAAAQPEVGNPLEVYPNPAHGQVYVRLEAARRPRQVRLLDGVGRVVLTRGALAQAATLVLTTAALPAGTYLLRVDYETGNPVTRRLTLE
ncbi:T9SS type A sorting domain-containing protein [Hymenobacter bucti]|uniref:T9SS type A sorting domain-containing protein n=1 Tax=Hymenobacter bucti TaxID=1844114 RepID=A0ABW4QN24_9BACT